MDVAQKNCVKELGPEVCAKTGFLEASTVPGAQAKILRKNRGEGGPVAPGMQIRSGGVAVAERKVIEQCPVLDQVKGTGKPGKNGGIQQQPMPQRSVLGRGLGGQGLDKILPRRSGVGTPLQSSPEAPVM